MSRLTKSTKQTESDGLQTLSLGNYEAQSGITTQEIIDRLGEIEDMIDEGTLPLPDVERGDTVYLLYKSAVILDCEVKKIQTAYDTQENAYRYFLILHNELYEKEIMVASTDFNSSWFLTYAEAETALAALNTNSEVEENA